MKTYEGLFIFPDSVSEEAAGEMAKKIQGEIEKAGGSVVEALSLGRRSFSRPLNKQEGGSYFQTIFKADPAQIQSLRGRFRLHDEIFRFQLNAISEKELAIRAKRAATVSVEAER